MKDSHQHSQLAFETFAVVRTDNESRSRFKLSERALTSALADPTLDLFGTASVVDEEPGSNQLEQRNFAENADSVQLYPHLYDAQAQSAKAILQLKTVIDDVSKAVDAFGDGEMNEVWSFLAIGAAGLTVVYQNSGFNKPFAMAISFTQRAMSLPNYESLGLADLFVLQRCLNLLYATPMLSLGQTVRLTKDLEENGWTGTSPGIETLSKEILTVLGYPSGDVYSRLPSQEDVSPRQLIS